MITHLFTTFLIVNLTLIRSHGGVSLTILLTTLSELIAVRRDVALGLVVAIIFGGILASTLTTSFLFDLPVFLLHTDPEGGLDGFVHLVRKIGVRMQFSSNPNANNSNPNITA